MNSTSPFTVNTAICPLAVSVAAGAVTRIVLNRRGVRPPRGALERRVARELTEYASGRRRRFEFAVRAHGTAFEREVWAAVRRIPYGDTATYGDIARTIGRPGAARAVGRANARNPVPIVIPCHRVVAAGGRLGGYGGGLELKRRLLALEQGPHTAQSVAGTASALLLAAALAASACAEPVRPSFGSATAPDTTPPVIEFLAPRSDSSYTAGDQLLVQLRVADRSGVRAVSAAVLGGLSFGYPTVLPEDTTVLLDYLIPTTTTTTGRLTFRVVASDTLGNRASSERSFDPE